MVFFFSTELAGALAFESLLEFLEDTPFTKTVSLSCI